MSDVTPPVEERASFAEFGERRPRAYVDSIRHTHRVRFFRRAIVITCVSVVALIGFVLAFDPLHRLQLGFSMGRVGIEGSKITMERPRLSGWRNDGQPYEIAAEAVTQDTNQPKIFELRGVDARLGGVNGETTRIQADKGVYDSGPDTLELTGSVRVHNQGRYDMALPRAIVDMRVGAVKSDEGVVVRLPSAEIEAGAVVFSESERTATFTGGVRSIFAGDPATAEAPVQTPQNAPDDRGHNSDQTGGAPGQTPSQMQGQRQ